MARRLNSLSLKVRTDKILGTVGPPMIDIRTLYQQTGYFTFDPGFTATGSCTSAITYIDGDEGHLAYRGY
jgi:citrate synthase